MSSMFDGVRYYTRDILPFTPAGWTDRGRETRDIPRLQISCVHTCDDCFIDGGEMVSAVGKTMRESGPG